MAKRVTAGKGPSKAQTENRRFRITTGISVFVALLAAAGLVLQCSEPPVTKVELRARPGKANDDFGEPPSNQSKGDEPTTSPENPPLPAPDDPIPVPYLRRPKAPRPLNMVDTHDPNPRHKGGLPYRATSKAAKELMIRPLPGAPIKMQMAANDQKAVWLAVPQVRDAVHRATQPRQYAKPKRPILNNCDTGHSRLSVGFTLPDLVENIEETTLRKVRRFVAEYGRGGLRRTLLVEGVISERQPSEAVANAQAAAIREAIKSYGMDPDLIATRIVRLPGAIYTLRISYNGCR